MSDYSGFKIKRPHSLAPLTSVYEAEAIDGRPGRFALKIFHPPASTHVRRFYAIEGWLLAAERQQQSAKKDGTVVEVLACGRCAEGAFAVMPWQEHFLEPWIKTLGQKGNTLRALAECLLNTIEAWEKETGGPHGNLKASNVFLKRTGPLVGMTAQLSDPAFLPGAKTEALQLADLNAVGTMLATIVRRRAPGAWPIEDAPEWKALGNAGKGWLDFCNYLLNPQPGEGEVTLAKARLRLKKVPKDANPAKTAALSLAAILVLGLLSLAAFARFGNPTTMPEQIFRLAQKLGNTQIKPEVPQAWIDLCVAWDTWLIDLQSNGPRLLQTKELWEPNDTFRQKLSEFLASSKDLLPASLIQEAASEKRLGVLANSPPEAVLNELQLPSVKARVQDAGDVLNKLNRDLENWPRWTQLRELKSLMDQRGFTSVAAKLQSKIPPQPGSEGYKLDRARTINFLRELSLDNTGSLPLASRWSEISHLSADMDASGDRIQKAMPTIILGRLVDMSSLSDFADSLVPPLEEMRQRRDQYNDQQVVKERFLKESPLQQETAEVTGEDIKRWEEELVQFTLVPPAENPSHPPAKDAAAIDASEKQLAEDSKDLEDEAPEGEPGQVTFSKTTYASASDGLKAKLQALRTKLIVRRDLPDVAAKTLTLKDQFLELVTHLSETLTLLKPETWLAKVRPPVVYGTFTESKRRWAAWQQATVPDSVTADSLRGKPNRETFRRSRDSEREIRAWINGLEGLEGFFALKVPDLAGTASNVTAAELKRLEAVLRDRAVTAVWAATEWRGPLPATPWAAAGANVKAPLEKHRTWLGNLPAFASELDQLSDFLTNGFELSQGVGAVADRLRGRDGTTDLAGKPAEWYAEANQLRPLEPVTDRVGLLAAAQGGGLSQKLTVWRRFDRIDGWPTGVVDFDKDGEVVKAMRQVVGRLKDEARRTSLLQEMGDKTRLRFNRAARTVTRTDRAEAELTTMFSGMAPAGLKDSDLDKPVAYNLELWRLKKKYDPNEKNLARLRVVRDTFVTKVRAIGEVGEAAPQSEVDELLTKLSSLELKDDPNRPPTPSPATVGLGWQEEPTGEGLALIATWKSGDRTVRLDYKIVQPEDDTPPFYLAVRAIAVGEFLDLMAGRPNNPKFAEATKAVKAALPDWANSASAGNPYDLPMAWRPRPDFTGWMFNPDWFYFPTTTLNGLRADTEARAQSRELEQAFSEKATLRTPLQQVSGNMAKDFAEKILGARLPTPKEWRAVVQTTGATTAGAYFRGPNVQKLFDFLKGYVAGGLTYNWRPNLGIFAVGGGDEIKKDEGRPSASTDENRLWFRPVDEGPKSGDFVNLFGNVSIFLFQPAGKAGEFYVAGGSVFSLPGTDFTQPQKVSGSKRVGSTSSSAGRDPYTDVGIRPAFDAPPGFKEWFQMNQLVRKQRYLTL